MLYGAVLEKLPDEKGFRLHIERTRSRWPILGFVALTVESQDPLLSLLHFGIQYTTRGRLVLLSKSSRFFQPVWDRWYAAGTLAIPPDVVLDDKALLFWLLGTWGGRHVWLPRLGGDRAPGRWPWRMRQGRWVVPEAEAEVRAWVAGQVPSQVLAGFPRRD